MDERTARMALSAVAEPGHPTLAAAVADYGAAAVWRSLTREGTKVPLGRRAHDLDVAVPDREPDRRRSARASPVRVGPLREEEGDGRRVAALGREEERRGHRRGGDRRVRASLEEEPRGLPSLGGAGALERSPARSLRRIGRLVGVGPGEKERRQRPKASRLRRRDESGLAPLRLAIRSLMEASP